MKTSITDLLRSIEERNLSTEANEALQDIDLGESGNESEWDELCIYAVDLSNATFELRCHSPGYGFTSSAENYRAFDSFSESVRQKIHTALATL